MSPELLAELSKITPEEQRILDGSTDIEKQLYTDEPVFRIDNKKFLQTGTSIAVRPHTRFVDFPVHSHDYVEIMYVCQGRITHVVEGKEITLLPGDFLFLNQQVHHAVKRAGENDIGINFIVLPEFFDIPCSMLDQNNILADFLLNTMRKGSADLQYLHFRTGGNACIDNLIENIVSDLYYRTGDDNIIQVTMGLVFLYLVNSPDTIKKDSSRSYQDLLIQTTRRYIRQHYQDASLQDLADSLHQSVPALSRLISRRTGHTFQELLQEERLTRAARLLRDTRLPVTEILTAVGYENSSYFYRIFEKKYGLSPRKYRLEQAEKNQEKM